MTPPTPTLRHERMLMRSGVELLACIDEVGRGALAGPVSVGVTVLSLSVGSAPRGLRDSKLLTPSARVALLPRLRRWPVAHAVGHTQPAEIDQVGIIAALRVAAARAFATLPVRPELALLDGNHDWVTDREPDALFPDPRTQAARDLADLSALPPRVVVRIKADQTCAGVAAASVLAKCERDAIMVELAAQHPQYGWALNKGYSAPEHIDALAAHGASVLHRCSWNLPGLGGVGADETGDPDLAGDPGFLADDALVEATDPETGRCDDVVDLVEPRAGGLSTARV